MDKRPDVQMGNEALALGNTAVRGDRHAFDSVVQARLRRHLGGLIDETHDTSILTLLDRLESAIDALFIATPDELHVDLASEIDVIAREYGVGVEVAHVTRRHCRAVPDATPRAARSPTGA